MSWPKSLWLLLRLFAKSGLAPVGHGATGWVRHNAAQSGLPDYSYLKTRLGTNVDSSGTKVTTRRASMSVMK